MRKMFNKTDGQHYMKIICMYLFVCIGVIAFSFEISNRLVLKNNLIMMDNTISLMAEKTNNSINVMTGYVEEASALLSSHRDLDFDLRYSEIKNVNAKLPYMSIGFVDMNGKIYGGVGEKSDFKKYDLIKAAQDARDVYITKPYRATGAGTNVITMFDAIYNDDKVIGYVFVTYPLTKIQSITNTGVLEKEAEVYIMSGRSGNYIRCTKTADYAVGSWNNLLMEKSSIECVGDYDINLWQKAMINGEETDTVCFKMNGRLYTQAFKRIDGMDGWYIVVRIPSEYLSSSINETVKVLGVTLVMLLAATLILAVLLLRNEVFQKNMLKKISSYDPLTKVLNRRAFYAIIHNFINEKERKPSILIYLDLDEFKPVNDEYGHDAGDKMLVAFASLLSKSFGEFGSVVRMGGDEFVVFIKNTDSKEFVNEKIAEFRERLENVEIEGVGTFNVKCSIGAAGYPYDTSEPEMLEKYADKALYHVKNNGKNYTCWYSEMDEQ